MLILCSWSYDTVAVPRNGYNHKWIEERISEAIDWPRVQSGILDVIQTIHTDAPVSHDLGVDQSFLQPAHLPNRLLWSDPKIRIRNMPPLPKFWEEYKNRCRCCWWWQPWCWLLSVKLWSCWKQKKIIFDSTAGSTIERPIKKCSVEQTTQSTSQFLRGLCCYSCNRQTDGILFIPKMFSCEVLVGQYKCSIFWGEIKRSGGRALS